MRHIWSCIYSNLPSRLLRHQAEIRASIIASISSCTVPVQSTFALAGSGAGSGEQLGQILDPADGAVRPGGYERLKDLQEGPETFGVAEDDFASFG